MVDDFDVLHSGKFFGKIPSFISLNQSSEAPSNDLDAFYAVLRQGRQLSRRRGFPDVAGFLVDRPRSKVVGGGQTKAVRLGRKDLGDWRVRGKPWTITETAGCRLRRKFRSRSRGALKAIYHRFVRRREVRWQWGQGDDGPRCAISSQDEQCTKASRTEQTETPKASEGGPERAPE